MAKDLDLLAAVRALHVAHVLDHAQNRHVHLLGHVDGLGDDHAHQVLRAGNDNDAVHGQRLEHGERHIAGARRHIDQQVVERTPAGLAPELADGAGDHGAAPQNRVGLVGKQQVAGHHLDAVGGDLGQKQVAQAHGAATAHAEHLGDGRAGNVGVQNAHLVPGARQLNCQRARDQRLAHAALAGQNGDDVLHLGQIVLIELLRSGLPARCLCVLATHGCPLCAQRLRVRTIAWGWTIARIRVLSRVWTRPAGMRPLRARAVRLGRIIRNPLYPWGRMYACDLGSGGNALAHFTSRGIVNKS